MTFALIDTPSRAASSPKTDTLELKNEPGTRQDGTEFGQVMSDVMGPMKEAPPSPSGQALADGVMMPPGFNNTFGGDALKAVHLGPHLNVITAETTTPDEQSLEAFARSQGLDETAVQWLMGSASNMPPAALPAQGSQTGLAGVASALPQTTITNTLEVTSQAVAADAVASLPGDAMKTGTAIKPDMATLQSGLNSAALWAMSQATEKARITSPAGDAAPDPANISLQMMPPPAPAAIWMLRHGLTANPIKESVTTKTGVALSELDLSEVASPELLESLGQAMAEGGTVSSSGAAPHPLSGHGAHRLDPAAAARQEAQNSDASAAAPDAALAQRSENVQNLAEKMGQAVGRRILSEIEKGQWHLKLSLRPATLGHIEVEMRMRSGELDAVFTAPQAMTRELLQEGMSKLKDTLSQMGMDVASMQVGDGQTQKRGGESTPGQMSKSTNTNADDPKSSLSAAPPPVSRMKMGKDGWDVLV